MRHKACETKAFPGFTGDLCGSCQMCMQACPLGSLFAGIKKVPSKKKAGKEEKNEDFRDRQSTGGNRTVFSGI